MLEPSIILQIDTKSFSSTKKEPFSRDFSTNPEEAPQLMVLWGLRPLRLLGKDVCCPTNFGCFAHQQIAAVVCSLQKTFAIFFPNSSENWKKSENLIGKAEHLP